MFSFLSSITLSFIDSFYILALLYIQSWAKVSLISLNDNIMIWIRDNTVGKGVDWLRLNAVLNNCLVLSRRPVHLLICFLAFLHQYFIHHIFLATNNACHNDIWQTSESMLVALGFELTAPGLTARVATGRTIWVRHRERRNWSLWTSLLLIQCFP